MKMLKWPIIQIVIQFGIILLWAVFFINNIEDFSLFLNKNYLILVLIIGLILIPILIKKYNFKDKKIIKGDILNCLLLGILLSIIYNTIIFHLNQIGHFTNLYTGEVNIVTSIIATGLIGPIIEELMFRGLIFNELKNKYPLSKSMLICTSLFAILHFNMVQIIYSFILGYLLVVVYQKSSNIKIPIVLHMSSNITTTLYVLFLKRNNLTINIMVLMISIIFLIIVLKKMYNSRKTVNNTNVNELVDTEG